MPGCVNPETRKDEAAQQRTLLKNKELLGILLSFLAVLVLSRPKTCFTN